MIFKHKEGVLICDLDNTLCDDSHRERHAPAPGVNDDNKWDKYHSRCSQDSCHGEIGAVVGYYNIFSLPIIFSTGRNEAYRGLTLQWLKSEVGLEKSQFDLIMRPTGCFETGSKLKPRMVIEHLRTKYANLSDADCKKLLSNSIVIDDDKRVTDAWEALGVTTITISRPGRTRLNSGGY